MISCHICFNQVGQLAQVSRLHRDAYARQQKPLVRHSVADIMPGKIWLTCIAIVTFFEFQSSAINPNHFGSILEAHPQFRAHQQKRPFWLTNWINNDYEDNDVGKNFDFTYFTEVLFFSLLETEAYSDTGKREETLNAEVEPLIEPFEEQQEVIRTPIIEESSGILTKLFNAMKEVQRLSRIGKNKLTPNGKAYYFRSL